MAFSSPGSISKLVSLIGGFACLAMLMPGRVALRVAVAQWKAARRAKALQAVYWIAVIEVCRAKSRYKFLQPRQARGETQLSLWARFFALTLRFLARLIDPPAVTR